MNISYQRILAVSETQLRVHFSAIKKSVYSHSVQYHYILVYIYVSFFVDPSCLRKNLLLQFSKIVKDIDVDDVRDVFLERPTVLNRIIFNRIKRRNICMATLLIKILKYGEALKAFVDALFIIDWSDAKQLIQWHSQDNVVETRKLSSFFAPYAFRSCICCVH